MGKNKNVNMYTAERVFEQYVEKAIQKKINRPIEWALYQTWKWADEDEEDVDNPNYVEYNGEVYYDINRPLKIVDGRLV